MLNFKKRIIDLKSRPLIKSILVLVTGTGIAQLFPIISAPIVARLYEPEHFGVYAVFYSLVTLFSGLVFLDYSNVVLVASNDQKAYIGLFLSAIIACILNGLLLVLIFIVPVHWLIELFGKDVVPFLWIVPITVLFNGFNTLLYTWFLRKGDFTLLSKNKIVLSICAVVFQIGIGFLYIGSIGFIIANLLSIIVSLVLLCYSFKRDNSFIAESVCLDNLKNIASEYRRFPLVSVWGNTLNIFTMQIPQFLINKVYGVQVSGQYSLAQRMISLPLGFISSAIQDVFKQGASAENIEKGNCKGAYRNTLKISLLVGGVILVSCLTFVPPLFVIVFGSKWADAGVYVKVLSLLFVVRFVVAPLSYTLYIKAKQHWDLFWQIGLFILSVLTLYGGYYWLKIIDPIELLILYSIVITIWYVFNLFITYNLSSKADGRAMK